MSFNVELVSELSSTLTRIGGRASLKVQSALSEKCCKKTQIYQDMYPDQETQLENIDLRHIVPPTVHAYRTDASELELSPLEMDNSTALVDAANDERSSDCKCGTELLWLIEHGWPRKLSEADLPEQLQTTLPEISPDHGPHVIFEQGIERDRAESSCICHLA